MIVPRTLKPFQSEAIDQLRSSARIDLALVAATGAGKGVVIEELARRPGERALLLCPLVALGRQFQQRFQRLDIPVSCRMGLTDLELRPEDRVWILSPESVQNERIRAEIRRWNPTLVTVDEAHCVEEWGERFRPEYGKLPHWLKDEGFARTLWMSATFPRTTRNRIEAALERTLRVQGTYEPPPGLSIEVDCLPWSERVDALLDFLATETRPGIIFTGTRRMTDRIGDFLHVYGRDCVRYHAGMSREERLLTERRLELRPQSVVVATSAFGMGMDYPQFRWALVMQPTYSLLGLLQSIGRVARNGFRARARVFWHPEDFQILGNQLRYDLTAMRRLAPLRRYLEQNDEARRSTIVRDELI